MSQYLNDRAVVLKTYKLKESDRIAVLLTEHNGVVKVVAKGARKGNSFASRIQPGSIISAQWYQKYELATLTQALSEYLPQKVGVDYEALRSVAIICEANLLLTQEGIVEDDGKKLFDMTFGVLKALENYDNRLCVAAFLWRLLLFMGMADSTSSCSSCGKSLHVVYFDLHSNEFVCEGCGENRVVLSKDIVIFLRYLESGQTSKALKLKVDNPPEVLAQIVKLFENITDYKFRSA